MRPQSWARAVVALLALLGAAAAWLAFAPASVGGAVTYVIVAGRSMEPHIKAGDLVLVRRAEGYQVGQVVAYQNREMGRTVLHRIIDVQGGRYVLRGDANDWVDTYRPTRDEILGRMWARIPKLGRALEWLRRPEHAAPVAGGVSGAMGLVGAGEAIRRRRRGGRPLAPIPVLGWSVVLWAALAVAFGALAAVAFTREEKRLVEEPLSFRHTGVFSYTAPALPSPAYDGPGAVTGEPVFLALARRMEVGFVYRLEAPFPHQVQGRARLLAQVGDPAVGGWRRTTELVPWRQFQGDEVGLSGTLDLGLVLETVKQVEKATGLALPAYRLSLVPEVEVEVAGAGGLARETFAPHLDFRLDSVQLAMEAAPSPLAGQAPADPLRPAQEGTLTAVREDDNTLSGLGVRAPVRAVRLASAIGGGVGLLGVVATAGLMAWGLLGGEDRRIRALYGHMILPVAQARLPTEATIEVRDMHALARLAQAQGSFILYEEERGRYLVATEGATYIYRPSGALPAEEAPTAPPEAPAKLPMAEGELSALQGELATLRQELRELAQELARLGPGQGEATPLQELRQEVQMAIDQVRREMREREQQLRRELRQRPSLWARLWGG